MHDINPLVSIISPFIVSLSPNSNFTASAIYCLISHCLLSSAHPLYWASMLNSEIKSWIRWSDDVLENLSMFLLCMQRGAWAGMEKPSSNMINLNTLVSCDVFWWKSTVTVSLHRNDLLNLLGCGVGKSKLVLIKCHKGSGPLKAGHAGVPVFQLVSHFQICCVVWVLSPSAEYYIWHADYSE